MDVSKKCVNCRFFAVGEVTQIAEKTGLCNRYPPAVAAIGVPQRNMAGDIQMGVMNVVTRPTVKTSDYCGEFQPVEPILKT